MRVAAIGSIICLSFANGNACGQQTGGRVTKQSPAALLYGRDLFIHSTVVVWVWAPPTSAAIWNSARLLDGRPLISISYPRHKDSTPSCWIWMHFTTIRHTIRFRHFAVLPTVSTLHLPFHIVTSPFSPTGMTWYLGPGCGTKTNP
eukprot:scaffold7276_cov106-Isochrysis_galbana.AAC.4